MKLTNIILTATMFAVNLFAWQIDKRVDENNWYLVNDNDFGIKKDKTIIIKVSR